MGIKTYKIVQHITKVIAENLYSFEDASTALAVFADQGKTGLEIVEIPTPIVTRLGRDPDLHT